jgi:hypothetical protein
MPLLGMTYAAYVALVGGSMVAFDAPPTPPGATPNWLVAVGRTDPQGRAVAARGAQRSTTMDVEWRPDTLGSWSLPWGLKPVVAAGAFADGGAWLGTGVRKDFRLGPLGISPHTGPVLYQSRLADGARSNEWLQFRTGFDVWLPLGTNARVGVGHYHLSNAQITRGSADTDAWRLSFHWRL